MPNTFSVRAAATAILASAATIAGAQNRPLTRADLAGLSDKGKPFEEVCAGRMIGIAVQTTTGKFFSLGGNSKDPYISAVAPICEGADGQRAPLVWHGGKGTDAEFVVPSGGKVIALSGTFTGRNGERLASLQLHLDDQSSPLFGTAARGNEEHITNDLFIQATPRRMVAVGIEGRGDDNISRIGVVYANEPAPQTVIALSSDSASRPAASDIAAAIERGTKARGKTEDASSRSSYMTLTGTGFYASIVGALNQIANDASANAKKKRPYTIDSVPSPVPAYFEVTVRPFDSEKLGGGKTRVDINTGWPTSIALLTTVDGKEVSTPAIWMQHAYFPTSNSDDSDGVNNPFVGGGLTGVFAMSALPAGEFSIRVVTALQQFTIKFDAKARAKIR